jgi:hypothetical protein
LSLPLAPAHRRRFFHAGDNLAEVATLNAYGLHLGGIMGIFLYFSYPIYSFYVLALH